MIDLLEDYCAREQVPGVAVCTFDSRGPTAMSCHGVAAAGCVNPVRPDTVFRIYSLTKLLTACAVVQLVRDGRVDLGSPLSNYVANLTRRPGPHATIGTVRQALSHTGGTVPDSLTWAPMGRNVDDLAVDAVRDYARAFSFAAPGRHYGYSNAGFNLAAVLIEQVIGRPFADAMAELVHQPVGMDVTTHDPAVAMTYPLAQHHLVTDVREGPQVIHRALAGSKWMAGSQCYSTLEEMTRFGSWLLGDLRDPGAGRARVDRPVADLRLDVGTDYGLGCYLTTTADGTTAVGHEGFFEGMWVKLVVDQATDRGVLWMDNRGDELRDARYRVIDKIMPGILPTSDVAPARGGPDGDAVVEDAAVAEGVYTRIGVPPVHVRAEGTDLVVTHDGRRRSLTPFGSGIWRAAATPDDRGPWRPHAGSAHVCLGVATPDPDGTKVVHLNAIPHAGQRRAA